MIITLWPNLRTPHGECKTIGWGDLCRMLSRPLPHQGDGHPGWSPAEFEDDQRAKEQVLSVWALCLDVDHGMSVEQALKRMAELKLGGHLHTTRKHTPTAHRFRVVVPLSRAVSAFEFEALWAQVAPQFGPVDAQAKDASRFWFLPGCPNPETFHAEVIRGDVLDVNAWLARPEPRPEAPAAPTRITTPAAERARRYIAKMPEAIAGSAGHKATFRVAVVLVRGFELDDATALSILEQDYNPRCQPPWKRRELAHKVDSARSGGRMPFGELVRRGDDWQPDWDAGYEPAEGNDEPWVDEERDAIQDEPNLETTDDAPAGKWRVVFIRDACSELLDVIGTGESVAGCTLGHYELDAALGGVRSEHVIGWGAGTSWGKSSAAIMAMDENLKRDNGVLIIGTEDAPGMYARRVLQRRAGINAIRMRDNKCTPHEVGMAAAEVAAMKNHPFLLPAVGMKGEQLALAIRDLVPALGIKLVIVDYIQRVRLQRRTQDRRNEVTMAAEILADAIKLAGAGGIILSQLKRLERGKRPSMNDLKESGDLENMCEHVIVGWLQDDVDETGRPVERRMVGLEKNKDGPAGGELELPFNTTTASFLTVARPVTYEDDDPGASVPWS